MRTIKFRAWDKVNKDFTYYDSLRDIAENWMCAFRDMLTQFEWQEYTGLKDKNGKEIYEGDIINGEQYNKKVVYSEGSTNFMVLLYYGNKWIGDSLSQCVRSGGEVIGNIYENPELLEDK